MAIPLAAIFCLDAQVSAGPEKHKNKPVAQEAAEEMLRQLRGGGAAGEAAATEAPQGAPLDPGAAAGADVAVGPQASTGVDLEMTVPEATQGQTVACPRAWPKIPPAAKAP
eukprot:3357962-Pyramimonas_sp.AAC.1